MSTNGGMDATSMVGLPCGLVTPVVEKFKMIADLGETSVPVSLDHGSYLRAFRGRFGLAFREGDFHPTLTDQNFSRVSAKLVQGLVFRTQVFGVKSPNTALVEDVMWFLTSCGALHFGAQGAALIFEQEQTRLLLTPGFSIHSFDVRQSLPIGTIDGLHRVPYLKVQVDKSPVFGLSCLDRVLKGPDAFFLFTAVTRSGSR